MNCDPYPAAICATCGDRLRRNKPRDLAVTWRPGVCGWCGADTSVTQPRDFGYPTAPALPASSGERPLPPPVTDPAAIPAASGHSPLRDQETCHD